MESLQQPKQRQSQSVNQLHADDTVRPSITVGVANAQPHNQCDSDDDEDRMLFNFFLSKYSTQQTEQQNQLDDVQSEDEDIRMFLQSQVPGLYRQHQPQQQCTNQRLNDNMSGNDSESSSLCVQYLGMSRWQKEEFFDNLNHLYMQRMRCRRNQNTNRSVNRKSRENKSNSNNSNKKRSGIRFSEIVSEVVFSKQDEPSVVGHTQQQMGVIVFDDQAYQQILEESESSQESINSSSNSNSSSESSSSSICSSEQSNTISNSDDSNGKEQYVDIRDVSVSQSSSVEQQERRCKRLINGQPVLVNDQQLSKELFNNSNKVSECVQQISGRKLVHHAVDDNTCDSQNNHNQPAQPIVLQTASSTNQEQNVS